jgi:DNA-binding NarL/FixJ family response regulator
MLALTFAAAVVAESALVRSGLVTILGSSPAIQVVAEASPKDADQLAETGIDVVVCNVEDLAESQELPQTPEGVPVLALVGTPEMARSLFRAGAKGVIARDASPDRLTAASVAVASGLCALDEASLQGLLVPVAPPAPVEPDVALLTPREREVLELLAEGLSNKVVALRLDISEHTAKFHVNSILDKLEADTRTDAVVRAARRGLLSL